MRKHRTAQSLLIGGALGLGVAAGVSAVLAAKKKREEKEPCPEHAALMTAKEMSALQKHLADHDPFRNQILSDEIRVSIDDPQTRSYLNTLVIGGCGSGKSFHVASPNLLQHNRSFVINDVGGEYYKEYAAFFEHHGYKVRCLNLRDPELSLHYNPFRYLRHDKDVETLVDVIMAARKPIFADDDPFFAYCMRSLLSAIVSYLFHEFNEKPVNQTFTSVLQMLYAGGADTDQPKTLDALFQALREKEPHCYAVMQYDTVRIYAGKRFRAVLNYVLNAMHFFDEAEIKGLMYDDGVDLESVFKEKTALFVILPVSHHTYTPIAAMLYSQIFDLILAQRSSDVPVSFILDEFCELGKLPGFAKKLALLPQCGASFMLFIQTIGQLKDAYPVTWKMLTANCGTIMILNGWLGHATVQYVKDFYGDPTSLILQYLQSNECILLLRNQKAMFGHLYDTVSHSEWTQRKLCEKKSRQNA